MCLKKNGKMILKQMVFRQTLLKHVDHATGTRNLNGTPYASLTKFMLCLTLVRGLRTGVCGWMQTVLFTANGTMKTLQTYFLIMHTLHMLVEVKDHRPGQNADSMV